MVSQLEVDFVADLGFDFRMPRFVIFGETDLLGCRIACGRLGAGIIGDSADTNGDVTGVLVATGDFSVHGGVADDGTFASGDLVAKLATTVLADAVVLEEGGARDILETEGPLADELYSAPVLAV